MTAIRRCNITKTAKGWGKGRAREGQGGAAAGSWGPGTALYTLISNILLSDCVDIGTASGVDTYTPR